MAKPKRRSSIFWSLPDRILLPALTAASKKRGASTSFERGDDGLYRAAGDGLTIAVADRRRLSLYTRGVRRRLNRLASDYGLSELSLPDRPIFVDCGANSGEFGVWLGHVEARYVAFEPDPFAAAALRANNPGADIFEMALGESEGIATLSLATASADSSLVGSGNPVKAPEGGVEVRVRRLDDVIAEIGITSIDVLKIEAEGFEPEVLAGAMSAVAMATWIAIDAGPEREGESTIVEVLETLRQTDFRLRFINLSRGCLLFGREESEDRR